FLRSLLVELSALPNGTFEAVIVDGKGEYDYIGLLPENCYAEKFPGVLLGHEEAPKVLDWLVTEEIPRRRELLSVYFKEHIRAPRQPREAYVQALTKAEGFPIRPILVVVDEFAE